MYRRVDSMCVWTDSCCSGGRGCLRQVTSDPSPSRRAQIVLPSQTHTRRFLGLVMITGLALGAALLLHTKVARAEHGLPNAVSTAATAKMPTARAEADVLAARYALSKNWSDETLFRRL